MCILRLNKKIWITRVKVLTFGEKQSTNKKTGEGCNETFGAELEFEASI